MCIYVYVCVKGKDRSEAGIERTFDGGGRREDRRSGGREGSLLGKISPAQDGRS